MAKSPRVKRTLIRNPPKRGVTPSDNRDAKSEKKIVLFKARLRDLRHLDFVIGKVPRLIASRKLEAKLRLCVRAADIYRDDLDLPRKQADGERGHRAPRPLRDRSIAELERLASVDDDDEALIELVRRDKGYLHTHLARAKIWLWNWQKWWWLDPRASRTKSVSIAHNARDRLEELGAAIAFAQGKKARWNSGAIIALAEAAQERLVGARMFAKQSPDASRAVVAERYALHHDAVAELLREPHDDRRRSRSKAQTALWIQLSVDFLGDSSQHEWARVLHRYALRAIKR